MDTIARFWWTPLAAVLVVWLLWVWYVCIMRLKMLRDAGTLTKAQKVFGYPALAVGLILDLFVDLVIGSILFLEWPNELTLSTRLWRLSNDPNETWRRKLALAIRTQLLDTVDPAGVHTG